MALAVLLAVSVVPLSAQERTEGKAYLFRFIKEKDMFFVPYAGNNVALDELTAVLKENMPQLRNGERYICVSSYAASPNDTLTSRRMAYLRNHRVKSELIDRAGVAEAMFVTDRHIPAAYGADSLRNVVVVTFPASVEKIRELAGEEAAAKAEAYDRKISGAAKAERPAAEQARQKEEQRVAAEKAEAERIAKEQEEQKRLADEKAAQERAEQERTAAGQEAQIQPQTETQASPYHFALRANLLRWATLTPDLGIEWRINRHVGVLVNGSWTSWNWDNKNRRYALWEVNPEVRWYLGERKAWYVGAMFKAGQFNYKLSETGKQGDLMGGGITGGYQLKLNKSLSMDFSLGLGYVNADVEKYKVIEGVRVRQGNETKHWFGPIQAGVTLVWKIGANRVQSRARSNYAKVQPDLSKLF